MAGWRTGVAVGNREAIARLFKLKVNIDSGQFLPVMEAATAAMTGDQTWLAERNLVYEGRRDLVIDHLHRMGLEARVPKASLYVWCPIPDGWKSRQFTAMMLEEAGLSLTPGDIFGPHGEGFVRISLTVPQKKIEEAMQRMEMALQRRGG